MAQQVLHRASLATAGRSAIPSEKDS